MMTKKWQPYPTYKDSGVEWLGAIPEHWEVNKFLRLAFFQEGPGLRNWQFADDGIKVICVTNITDKGIIFNNYSKFIDQEDYCKNYKHFTVNFGDLLLSSSGNSWGKVAEYLEKETVILNTSTIRINQSSKGEYYKIFIKWILQSDAVREQLVLLMTGSCQPNFGPSHLAKLLVPVPPLPEQQKIAQFLDQETSKIDKLITKKERLIELLKEKRTALISHAVTKGLNPDVPMKDSGVEWLGEIPEHWEIVPLRSVLEQRIEYNIGRKTENILSVIKDVGVVNYEDREASGNKKSENIEQYKIIYPSDIVVNRMNLIFGSVGIAREYGASSTEYYVLKPKSNKVCQEYYGHIFCSKSFQLSLVGIGKGILFHRMRIYSEELKKILFPFPPLEEQKLINEYLIQNLNEINHLSDKLNTSIDHLKEYRTALISAAVTGKIDVREH
ncbi:restriction modification system DNA specificity domain protein [Microcystis aeruginosa NIES-3787]|uniref:Restriction modification system DNA specificity domain protein n=2 Tax=Microcystis aeruginosa TaxID=1126 RepID=A0A6H9FJZ9_MICAE|nr:restriction modification system DNA specificity domain protein [Microcystis aeruginosa NIES-3787]